MHTHHKHSDPAQADDFDWNDSYTGKLSDYEAPDPDLLEIVEGLTPGRALDVGCGAGGLVLALAERGWEVTGLDIAERAISSARCLLSQRAVSAELIVADAALWAPAVPYDLISSSFALPDRPKRTDVLRMMGGALAPGGVLALKEFDSTMARHSFFAGYDLPTPQEFVEAFPALDIERAEVIPTPVHEHAERGAGSHDPDPGDGWTAALLLARRPRTDRRR